MKMLPIGISTLEKMIHDDCVYIDKTQFVARLSKGSGYYFLSRPRRFGKSLLVDTLKQAFSGNKKLFKGLYLEENWDWSKSYPVIHFDFGVSSAYDSEETLLSIIWDVLNKTAKEYNITLDSQNYGLAFDELIKKVAAKANATLVVLIDEYDKPILDVITDSSQALVMREMLKGLYSVIKVNDAHLRFVLLTGVTKFSKVGLFSGLNNLSDITLHPDYADVCGYTQADLEREFKDYLMAGNIDKTQLKLWYNGYHFLGTQAQKVYNPFDILLFFSNNFIYRNYWFETGSPSFLIKLVQKNKYYFPDMEDVVVTENLLASFDVDNISLLVVLLQAGYLTIKKMTTVGTNVAYILNYPNLEVKKSLNNSLAGLASTPEQKEAILNKIDICLREGNINGIGEVLKSHFASIPHDWYPFQNNMQYYEGFYASIIYSYFCALGYNTIAEDKTNVGRIDLTVELPDKFLIFEFKLRQYGNAKSALKQIKEKKYAEKYRSSGKPIYLLGMSFDVKTRNLHDFISEVY